MKKNKLIFPIIIVVLILSLLIIPKNYKGFKHKSNLKKYDNKTENLTTMDSEYIVELESNQEPYILYVGSSDCPACVNSIDNVLEILSSYNENEINSYYYPVEMYTDDFGNILKQLELEYIPSIVYFDGNNRQQIEIKKDSI